MRTATGTDPVSITRERIAAGSGLESVMTRKLLRPHATVPSDATAPTTSTTAATISVMRTAVRPPGESGGGGLAGAGGGGAMVVTIKTLLVV